MKRSLMIVAVLGLLVVPLVSWADEDGIEWALSQANWTSTPPYQGTIGAVPQERVAVELQKVISDVLRKATPAAPDFAKFQEIDMLAGDGD